MYLPNFHSNFIYYLHLHHFFYNLQESPVNDESNRIMLINENLGSGKTVHDHIFSIFKIYYILHFN